MVITYGTLFKNLSCKKNKDVHHHGEQAHQFFFQTSFIRMKFRHEQDLSTSSVTSDSRYISGVLHATQCPTSTCILKAANLRSEINPCCNDFAELQQNHLTNK